MDARIFKRKCFSELADEKRFREPGYSHEQGMTTSKQADAELLDDLALADDDSTEFACELLIGGPQSIDGLYVVVG